MRNKGSGRTPFFLLCDISVLPFGNFLSPHMSFPAEELKEKSIWVTAVCPGPADTEFFERAEKYGSTLAIKKSFTLWTSIAPLPIVYTREVLL